MDNAVRAGARVAGLDVSDNLSPTPPYWGNQLFMNVVDTYRYPGVVVEVLDAQGAMRYLSTNGMVSLILLSADTARTVLAGQTV